MAAAAELLATFPRVGEGKPGRERSTTSRGECVRLQPPRTGSYARLDPRHHEYDGKMYRCLVQSTALGNKYGYLCLFQYALKFARKLKPWWQTSESHGKSSLSFARYF